MLTVELFFTPAEELPAFPVTCSRCRLEVRPVTVSPLGAIRYTVDSELCRWNGELCLNCAAFIDETVHNRTAELAIKVRHSAVDR